MWNYDDDDFDAWVDEFMAPDDMETEDSELYQWRKVDGEWQEIERAFVDGYIDEDEDPESLVIELPSVVSLKEEDIYRYSGAKKYATLADVVLQSDLLAMYEYEIYLYKKMRGCWKRLTKCALEEVILKALKAVLTEAEFKALPVKGLETIKEKIRWELLTREKIQGFSQDVAKINLANGSVSIKQNGDIELLPHAANQFFDYCLNFKYIPKNERKATPTFDKYFKTSFATEVETKRKLWLQMLGYLCGSSMKGKCFFVLVGASNSGKTVTTNLLEHIFPEEDRSSVSLYDLENQFARANFWGKKINIQSELPSNSLAGIDYIKSLTSGDSVSAAFKGKDIFFFRNKCKLVIATNTLPHPKSDDPTDGFLNRLVVLVYPQSIPKEKQDLQLLEKLIAEIDDIASCAIDEYAELLKNNFAFEEPMDSKRYKAVYKNLGNSFALFLQDEVVFHPDAKVHSKELKEKLAAYEEENGMEKTPPAKIKEILQENSKVMYKKFLFKEKNSWGYAGIGLKSDFPELCKNLNEARNAEGEGEK